MLGRADTTLMLMMLLIQIYMRALDHLGPNGRLNARPNNAIRFEFASNSPTVTLIRLVVVVVVVT